MALLHFKREKGAQWLCHSQNLKPSGQKIRNCYYCTHEVTALLLLLRSRWFCDPIDTALTLILDHALKIMLSLITRELWYCSRYKKYINLPKNERWRIKTTSLHFIVELWRFWVVYPKWATSISDSTRWLRVSKQPFSRCWDSKKAPQSALNRGLYSS